MSNRYHIHAIAAVSALAFASLAGTAAAQSAMQQGTGTQRSGTASVRTSSEDGKDAIQQVNKAVQVVGQMEQDAGMKRLLRNAKGVFIVPDYGRAALGVGARGGEGVLLVKHGNRWGDPSFYTLGGISAGAEAGVEAGAIALVLNNEKAVKSFRQDNNFSLNAEAGLTIVNWSPKVQGSAGKGDVVVWADTEGLFGDLAVSVTDINFDEAEAGAYYGRRNIAANDIINGRVRAPAHANALKQALARASVGGTSAGSSGTRSSGNTSSGNTSSGAQQDTTGQDMNATPGDTTSGGMNNR